MGRKPVILQSEFPYHVSARCINREWFDSPLEQVWQIFGEELARTTEDHRLLIHSFVLMSNHFHLIASTPNSNISQCMHQFMRRSSLRITKSNRRINETFAGRHHKCVLDDPGYFLNAYKYVYRNPVAAGACLLVDSYPYSSLQAVMGFGASKFPFVDDTTYNLDPSGTLAWLNEPPPPEKLEAFKSGLRRSAFQSKKGKDRRPLFGPSDRL